MARLRKPPAATGILAGMTPSQIAFYATVATIIPVLYIALAVQGNAGASLVSAAWRILSGRKLRTVLPRTVLLVVFLVPAFIATVIVLGGALAESVAIWTLYKGAPPRPGSGPIVLWLTIFLVVAVTAGPLLDYLRVGFPQRETVAPHPKRAKPTPSGNPRNKRTR